MNTWKINGPTKISGKVKINGNKNSTFPCIGASLLLSKPKQSIILENVPRIRDVFAFCDITTYLGVGTKWLNGSSLQLSPASKKIKKISIPQEVMAKIRGSIVLLGPLVAKFGSFSLPKPGGDKIGSRPLTAHAAAFRDLGFAIEEEGGGLIINSQNKLKLEGLKKTNKIWLTERSVTATSSLLLFSSSLNPGQKLIIFGAACEPHISTLCGLLSKMGANIEGQSSNILTVTWPSGIAAPHEKIKLDDDYLEATTYAVAAALTRSDLVIEFDNPENLELIDRYIKWMGVKTKLNRQEKKWEIYGSRNSFEISPELKTIKAEPWPGFPTDIMSLFVVLATQCKGTIKFIEYMYEDRFTFIQTLKDMGAQIEENYPHVIKVHGPTKLSGLETFIRPDIRSGAAMLVAALTAQGPTVLHDKNDVISRGYEKLPETLKSLGADIENG